MGGVATFVQPDYPTQSNGTGYPSNIDAAIAVLAAVAGAFAAHESSPTAMTVTVDAGRLWDGANLIERAQQVTGAITAPTTDPRIDRVVIDRATGDVEVITGAEAAAPVAPAIPEGKIPVCRVNLTTGTQMIMNAALDDERGLIAPRAPGGEVDSTHYASLEAAVADIGASQVTLRVSAALYATANVTVPPNIHLKVAGGGALYASSGVTATIQGAFNAPLRQVFFGSGAFDLSAATCDGVWFVWFGTTGTSDDTAAAALAISAAGQGGLLRMHAPVKIDGQITVLPYQRIKASGGKGKFLCDNTVSHSILLGGSYITFDGVGLETSGNGLGVKNTVAARFCTFRNFLAVGLKELWRVEADAFWGTIENFQVVNCERGVIQVSAPYDLNAFHFTDGVFNNATPVAGKYAIEAYDSDGITIQGVDMQNYGPRFDNCQDVVLKGGYWEAYSPNEGVLTAVNGTSLRPDGLYMPSATITAIDDSSYRVSSGLLPCDNKFAPLAPTATHYHNIFPDPDAATQAAIDALDYSATGVHFGKSINAGGYLELTTENQLARSGFALPLHLNGVGICVTWRVTSGAATLALYGTQNPTADVLDSTQGWRTTRLTAKITAGTPGYVLFGTSGPGEGSPAAWTIEIDDIVVDPSFVCIGNPPPPGLSDVHVDVLHTFADQDATPDVRTGRVFLASNTAATTITQFDQGTPGQLIEVFATNGNTTIAHNGNIALVSGANEALSTNECKAFRLIGTVWIEVKPQ